ncbi:hypothetical protein J4440_00135 [Candidatus Woesearchaeota archaeon]|nr:hypothetical protein [Candidatus Woesearchaeota archaeon]
MLSALISIIGIFIGLFIASYTGEELKDGKKYFFILQIIILLSLIVIVLLINFDFLFLSGLLFGLLIRREYLFFGILVFSNFSNNISFLINSLIFIYSLAYGSLIYLNKNFKYIIFDVILFLIPLTLYFLKFDIVSFAAGSLISILGVKTVNLIKFSK